MQQNSNNNKISKLEDKTNNTKWTERINKQEKAKHEKPDITKRGKQQRKTITDNRK